MSALLRRLPFLSVFASHPLFIILASFDEVGSNFISKLGRGIEDMVETPISAPVTASSGR